MHQQRATHSTGRDEAAPQLRRIANSLSTITVILVIEFMAGVVVSVIYLFP